MPPTELKTVLCPIDFSDLSRKELALGVEVCRHFGAHLVLHHNRAAASPGFARAAEWSATHQADQDASTHAEERLRSIMAELPPDIAAEASLSAGPLVSTLLDLASDLSADLMILGSHGWSTPDHASVTERVVERSPCPVLTIHDDSQVDKFTLRAGGIDLLVATDLTDTGAHAMAYAFDLARRIPMRVHVLHIAAPSADGKVVDTLLQQLYGLVPPDLVPLTPLQEIKLTKRSSQRDASPNASSVECYVRRGDPIQEILEFGEHLDPTFLVMGEHAHTFFRRHFTRDSAVQVLHRAAWPVWFVPARQTP